MMGIECGKIIIIEKVKSKRIDRRGEERNRVYTKNGEEELKERRAKKEKKFRR